MTKEGFASRSSKESMANELPSGLSAYLSKKTPSYMIFDFNLYVSEEGIERLESGILVTGLKHSVKGHWSESNETGKQVSLEVGVRDGESEVNVSPDWAHNLEGVERFGFRISGDSYKKLRQKGYFVGDNRDVIGDFPIGSWYIHKI
jgi:hypothetical protein